MKLIVSIWITALSFGSFSQIVNIENKRLFNNKQGFNGSAEFNFDFTMNTKEVLQLGDIIRMNYLKNKHQFLVVTDHSIIKTDGNNSVNKGFQHFRYIYSLIDSGKVSYEVFQQAQFNRVQRINVRLLLGTGFRFNLIDKNNYQLIAGSGIMAEYEDLIEQQNTQDILSTSYLSFDVQLNKSIGFNTITYIQPKFIDFGNYRFSNETSLRLIINKHLNFKFTYSVTHDSRNITGVRKTNYEIENSLQFRL